MKTTITKELGDCNCTIITQKQRKNKPTLITVYSELYELDATYQDVTLDTEWKEWQDNQLSNLFKNITP